MNAAGSVTEKKQPVGNVQEVLARRMNAASVEEAIALCEEQGIRLKAHGKGIIQVKSS